MLMSMTGFGGAVGEVQGVEYAVELRSVNNRYLKVSLRLPDSLGPMEGKIEKLVRDRLQRGSVSVAIRMKVPDDQAAYYVNAAVLQAYLEQIRALEADANPQVRLDLAGLMQLPGVCTPPALEELAEKTADGMLALVGEALENLCELRAREGQAIADDLRKNADALADDLAAIAERSGEVVELYHQRLKTRVEELTASAQINIDQDTLAREVAIFAERSDIAEEVSRLSTHIQEFRDALAGDGAIGRRLDFMSQEMLREANTIGSKASDADIARRVVNMKTAIDRIKEQAANVE